VAQEIEMKRVLIYSQCQLEPIDLRCMTAIANRLLRSCGSLELHVISGSGARGGGRAWQGVAQTVLPDLRAAGRAGHAAPKAAEPIGVTLGRRRALIQGTIAAFAPDLILVDKLPFGLYDELQQVFAALKEAACTTKCVLLLRDLIGNPQRTSQQWRERGYFDTIADHYEKVLVLGEQEVFDLQTEYEMPERAAAKLEYCGYVEAAPGRSQRDRVRRALNIQENEPLVLIDAGAGSDGETLIRTYIAGVHAMPAAHRPRSHIVCGDGMRESERLWLACNAHALPQVSFQHVSRDIMSLMSAADVVVATGSYQKTCELLTLQRRAVVVPSAAEASEQTLRAERLAALGLLRLLRPSELAPQTLLTAVLGELLTLSTEARVRSLRTNGGIDFVTSSLLGLMDLEASPALGETDNPTRASGPFAPSTEFELSLRAPLEIGTFGLGAQPQPH
jgi:predicted glycosyltransferase